MRTSLRYIASRVGFLFVPVLLLGCGAKDESVATVDPLLGRELGSTIGSVADVAQPEPVAVEGYGLVAGLAGTGSGACPPDVRAYLK